MPKKPKPVTHSSTLRRFVADRIAPAVLNMDGMRIPVLETDADVIYARKIEDDKWHVRVRMRNETAQAFTYEVKLRRIE